MMLSKALQAAAGNAGAAGSALYVDDVFSTWLYTGNGTSQTITNGIDLAGEGGLVWIKDRAISSAQGLFDTVSGATKYVQAQSSTSQNTDSTTLTSFNSNGFSLGSNGNFNSSSSSIAAWTFRQQAKFCTVVSWTGNGANRAINHDLGSVPGCILIKCKSNVGTNWAVYHRSIANTEYLTLNTTDAKATNTTYWNSTTPTNTQFFLGTSSLVNANGFTYVAYLFAHDAGGFGAGGSENVISCGSFTANANTTVNLGFEPQWIMIKNANAAYNWGIFDVMRGWTADGNIENLKPNLSDAETQESAVIKPTATGFEWIPSVSGNTYIYIAIRRPMKPPASGTEVFSPIAVSSATSTGTLISSSFVVDAAIATWRNGVVERGVNDRLRGIGTTNPTGSGNPLLRTNLTNAETTPSNVVYQGNGNAVMIGRYFSEQGYDQIYWLFRRAPGFFDVVCYTGNGSPNRAIPHNLGVAPELVIYKCRNDARDWATYPSPIGITGYLELNSTNANNTAAANNCWSAVPNSLNLNVKSDPKVNANTFTYVAYLFATYPGVSKVGSYTGTGTTLQINCGFTGGARFVMIKRTDSTGDWYVWDSARGIVAGNDPYLLMNSTAVEVTGTDYIDTYSAGFEISSTAPAAINANGGSFIFLAIA